MASPSLPTKDYSPVLKGDSCQRRTRKNNLILPCLFIPTPFYALFACFSLRKREEIKVSCYERSQGVSARGSHAPTYPCSHTSPPALWGTVGRAPQTIALAVPSNTPRPAIHQSSATHYCPLTMQKCSYFLLFFYSV